MIHPNFPRSHLLLCASSFSYFLRSLLWSEDKKNTVQTCKLQWVPMASGTHFWCIKVFFFPLNSSFEKKKSNSVLISPYVAIQWYVSSMELSFLSCKMPASLLIYSHFLVPHSVTETKWSSLFPTSPYRASKQNTLSIIPFSSVFSTTLVIGDKSQSKHFKVSIIKALWRELLQELAN